MKHVWVSKFGISSLRSGYFQVLAVSCFWVVYLWLFRGFLCNNSFPKRVCQELLEKVVCLGRRFFLVSRRGKKVWNWANVEPFNFLGGFGDSGVHVMMPLQNGQSKFWKASWNDNIFRKAVIPSQWLSASTDYLFTIRERKSGSRVAGVSGRRTVEMYGGWVSWSSNWSLEIPSTKLTYPTLGQWTSIFKSALGWEWMGYFSYEEGTFPLL